MKIKQVVVPILFTSLACFGMEKKNNDHSKELIKRFGFEIGQGPQIERKYCINYNGKRVYTSYYGKLSCYNLDQEGEKRFSIPLEKKEKKISTTQLALPSNETYAHTVRAYFTWQQVYGLVASYDGRVFVYDLYSKNYVKKISYASVKGGLAIAVNGDSTQALIGAGNTLTLYSLPDCKRLCDFSMQIYQENDQIRYVFFAANNVVVAVSTKAVTLWSVLDHSEFPQKQYTLDFKELTAQPKITTTGEDLLIAGKGQDSTFQLVTIGIAKNNIGKNTVDDKPVALAISDDTHTLVYLDKMNSLHVLKISETNEVTYKKYNISVEKIESLSAVLYFKEKDWQNVHLLYNDGTEKKVDIET